MKSPKKLIQESLALYRKNFQTLFVLSFIPIFATALMEFVVLPHFFPFYNTALMTGIDTVLVFILIIPSIVLSTLSTIALTYAIAAKSLRIGHAYKKSFPVFWRYLGVSLLVAFLILAGFILFIIPGIFIMVTLMFATYVTLFEEKSILSSLKASREYVHGKWFAIFGRLIVVICIAMVVTGPLAIIEENANSVTFSALNNLVEAIFTPFIFAYIYLMYKDVAQTPKTKINPL